jgi:serine/threonine protein phosphatase 1
MGSGMSIARLFGRSEERPAHAPARVPEGTRVYAIGDIHGQLDQLRALEAKIAADAVAAEAQRRVIVYLGDYVDRGQDSAGTVAHLLEGPPEGFEAVHLIGNHEAMMLEFLEDPESGGTWLRNGGDSTLASYGVDLAETPDAGSRLRHLGRRFAEAVPTAHRRFLEGLARRHEEGGYLFVHAGVRPGVALDAQDPDDLIWIRYPFLQSKADFGKVVVHGHTPEPEPVERDNRFGIDTGAVYGGHLTALVLDGAEHRYLQA